MSDHELRLIEDTVVAGGLLALAPVNRVVYVVKGSVVMTANGAETLLSANEARHSTGECRLRAGKDAVTVWRWEVDRKGRSEPATRNLTSTVKLAHEIEIDSKQAYLIRCDRVDFPAGGIAYTHTHRGGGIRALLHGEFRVDTDGRSTVIHPGGAWFESGPAPVYAEAPADQPAGFVRVMILPAELRGKSSIRYVKPEDEPKPKLQTYSVFVDVPIAIKGDA